MSFSQLNKEDLHCYGEECVNRVGKVMNVLDISALLSGNNFQFNTDEILAVLDPVLDILFWLSEEFFFGELKNPVLGVLW